MDKVGGGGHILKSLRERLQSFLKTQVMHMISPVIFVVTCDNDATHLTCHIRPRTHSQQRYAITHERKMRKSCIIQVIAF